MSDVVIVSGSAGLIGSETTRLFASQGLAVVGIDNDMRAEFFGEEASTRSNRERLEREILNYTRIQADIQDEATVGALFSRHGKSIAAVVHMQSSPHTSGLPVIPSRICRSMPMEPSCCWR